MNANIIAGALIAAPVAVWFGVYGLVLLATRPGLPDPAPATEDLGPEPPAVVSLLVNRWEVTEDSAESTLLDLGARHILEFRQPAADPNQTTVHIRQPNPAGLAPWEQRVFNRVNGLAKGGVVPLTALTFRDRAEADSWAKRLTAEVVAEARSHGLSQRRLGPALVGALTAAAAAAAVGVAAGVGYYLGKRNDHHTGSTLLVAGFIAFVVLAGFAARPHGERDTPAGREAAARWLGVRAWLRGHDAFADLPPAAVAVWDRYLSYGAAVGATRVSSAVIDLGMGNRRRVWSSYGGPGAPPSWHRVRVHYPRFWPRYGKTGPRLIVRAILVGAIGVVLIRFWYKGVDRVISTSAGDRLGGFADLIRSIGLVVGFVLLGYGIYVLVRTIIDLAAPATVTGEVVWTEVWRSTGGGENSPPSPVLYYLAVDDASDQSTRAWAMPVAMKRSCADGDVVTIAGRRWSRRVVTMTMVQQGNARQMAAEAGLGSSGLGSSGLGSGSGVEDMIAAAMGIPNAGSRGGAPTPLAGLITPLTPVGPLVTPEEVAAALGMPIALKPNRNGGRPAPMEITEYAGPDGSVVLTVVRGGGFFARMAMRSRARGEVLPGIGDEARGGQGWVAARRGDEVLLMHVGHAAQATPPRNLAGLAYTAVSRLPTPVS